MRYFLKDLCCDTFNDLLNVDIRPGQDRNERQHGKVASLLEDLFSAKLALYQQFLPFIGKLYEPYAASTPKVQSILDQLIAKTDI